MPVLADIGLIWVVFVVISIVAQIIKAKKNATPQSPDEFGDADAPQRPVATSREDELRKFMETLRGGTATARPVVAAPPPPPPARRVPQTVRRAAPVAQRKDIQRTSPKAKSIAIMPEQKSSQKKRSDPVTLTRIGGTSAKTSALKRLIREELRQKDATRKSLVLREILGPPLALKSRESAKAYQT
jgi:hypothetical protein